MDHIKFSAMMFTMALKAILLYYIGLTVQSLLIIHQTLNFLMALQTFFVGHFVPQIMTLGTIGHAFQIRMGIG
jgi:hypothetical protein